MDTSLDGRPAATRAVGAAVLSVAVVALPAAGAVSAARLAWRLTESGAAVTDGPSALLRLACLASLATLAWATAAVVAGVREAWRVARSGPAQAGSAADPSGARPATGRPKVQPRPRRVGVVSATVTAVVVAALTAPTASASPGSAGPAVPVASPEAPGSPGSPGSSGEAGSAGSAGSTAPDVAADADWADAPATARPGSWSSLVTDGFRAPRTVDPASAALVAPQATRRTDPPTAPTEVVVRAGDSLWSLAASRLPAGADDTEVAAAWPAWWHANRDVIGDDPDLLLPGQRLRVPSR